ncbi:hypothetical protein ASC77_05130 [Nocardioides sp. Root1257]|uniref:hypothetical protein n=1 Tax=unclassified Nocardioides TaxID=2615069 RepID=UPI0006F80595|nr:MULTISPECIES: hypothetical protein [unclassified Nocardioides]KQW53653.1 hypothetical protein ASC77_05130 [Nocardioides sp. Root1257]KRC56339.1 hypothetical protein ASE24_05130 [Nocardioides sp. Root224]
MSLATSVGHSVTGLVGHRAHLHLPRRRSAAPAATTSAVSPDPAATTTVLPPVLDIDTAVAHHHDDLAQWSAAFTIASQLSR